MRHRSCQSRLVVPTLTLRQHIRQVSLLPGAGKPPTRGPRRRLTKSGVDPLVFSEYRFLLNFAADFNPFRQQFCETLFADGFHTPGSQYDLDLVIVRHHE